MRDQAAELRSLVLRSSRQARISAGPPPKISWIVGAREKVGCTTVAMTVAEVLAEQGFRIVLISADAAANQASSAIDEPDASRDWVRKRLEIHEVLKSITPGLQYVPSLGTSEIEGFRQEHRSWLYRQLCTLGPHADLVIIDGDHRDDMVNKSLCEMVDHAAVITTPSARSVVDGYLRLKKFHGYGIRSRLSLLVNQAASEEEAKNVWLRVSESCQRFLERSLDSLGYVPISETLRFQKASLGDLSLDESSELFGYFKSMGTLLVAGANRPWSTQQAA